MNKKEQKKQQLRREKAIKVMDKAMLFIIMRGRIQNAIINLYYTQADTKEEKDMLGYIAKQINYIEFDGIENNLPKEEKGIF